MNKKLFARKYRMVCLGLLIALLSLVTVACSADVEGDNSSNPPENTDNTTDNENNDGETKSFEGLQLKAATHDPQTASYVFTAALAEILRNEDKVELEVLPYAGGIGNVELVSNGEADFGITFNIAAKWAREGIIAYDRSYDNIMSLAAGMGYYNIGVIARDEFLEEHNITSIADIKEREIPVRVITNPAGSMAEFLARITLEAYGMDYDMINSFGGNVEFTSSDVILNNMQDGTADLYLMTYSASHAVITEMSLHTDITLLSIKEDEVKDHFQSLGFIRDASFSAEEYGQDEIIESPGFNVSYIIRDDVDEEVAYLLAKRFSENHAALKNAHAIMAEFDPSIAGHSDINAIPLHPGAKRYYEEVGAVD